MPQLIDHIDALARQKNRDVLFVHFGATVSNMRAPGFENYEIRKQVTAWLDAHEMAWEPCGPAASVNVMQAYDGQIYVDVPFDEENPAYRAVRDFLEKPDGTPAHDGATFCYYRLEDAMKNAHHDEPGFWEKWADGF